MRAAVDTILVSCGFGASVGLKRAWPVIMAQGTFSIRVGAPGAWSWTKTDGARTSRDCLPYHRRQLESHIKQLKCIFRAEQHRMHAETFKLGLPICGPTLSNYHKWMGANQSSDACAWHFKLRLSHLNDNDIHIRITRLSTDYNSYYGRLIISFESNSSSVAQSLR